jgi:hypothetical protein
MYLQSVGIYVRYWAYGLTLWSKNVIAAVSEISTKHSVNIPSPSKVSKVANSILGFRKIKL